MNKIIKKLKTIFETFTILTLGWDFEYGIFYKIKNILLCKII